MGRKYVTHVTSFCKSAPGWDLGEVISAKRDLTLRTLGSHPQNAGSVAGRRAPLTADELVKAASGPGA